MPSRKSPHISQRQRDRKRRRQELLLAACLMLVVFVVSWALLFRFGTDSYVFLPLLNFNMILLLGVLFVVARNTIKLLLERHNKVLGVQIRIKLVLAFMSLTLIPCVLMFFLNIRVVQFSVDWWFKNQVDASMDAALDVGRTFLAQARERLNSQGVRIVQDIKAQGYLWGGQSMNSYLDNQKTEQGFALLGVLSPAKSEQNWHTNEDFINAWPELKTQCDWENLATQQNWCTELAAKETDYVFCISAIDKGSTGYLVLASGIGKEVLENLDYVARGAGEYKQLRNFRQPLKWTLYFSMAVLTLLIILGAFWFGFRIAREFTAPILALVAGTERIARGDLQHRIEGSSPDELGILIKSFNKMTEDLEQNRTSLTGAYTMLEKQNITIAQHSKYIETILNTITAGVVSFDMDGYITTVNSTICTYLACPPEELLGKNILAVIPQLNPRVLASMNSQFERRPDSHWRRQFTITTEAQEERYMFINAVALINPAGEAQIVAVVEDVTELEKMQRVAAWREVARRIAHEIKNPLTPIKLSAQRLQRKFAAQLDDPVFVQSTDIIVRQVERLQELVGEFSSFAKIPEVHLSQGDIVPLVTELMTLFANSHSSIKWTLDCPESLPLVRMDRDALYRVFMNIFTNAVEALLKVPEPEVIVHLQFEEELGLLQIHISDNGLGLSSEEKVRLFEPYFSQKSGGTGLGLAIVKSIVDDHQGYVRAMDNSPSGTTLVIELPIAAV